MSRRKPPLPPLHPEQTPDGRVEPVTLGPIITETALALADTGNPFAAWVGNGPCQCGRVRFILVTVLGALAEATAACSSCGFYGKRRATVPDLRRRGASAWRDVRA